MKNNIHFLLLVILFVSCTESLPPEIGGSNSAENNIALSGRIISSETSLGINNLLINISGDSSYVDTTEADGNFMFLINSPGLYNLSLNDSSHLPFDTTINLAQDTALLIYLEPIEQDTSTTFIEAVNYFPVHVGDFWLYTVKDYPPEITPLPYEFLDIIDLPVEYTVRREVTDKLTYQGKEYYFFKSEITQIDTLIEEYGIARPVNSWLRYDEYDGFIKQYYNWAQQDSIIVYHKEFLAIDSGYILHHGYVTRFIREEIQLVLGKQTKIKEITYVHNTYGSRGYYKYAQGIGLISVDYKDEYYQYKIKLKGAFVDNEVFGDTSLSR